MDMTNLAEATAAHLGGVAGIGVEVRSDADLARAVGAGFNVKAIDALRQSGVTGGELAPEPPPHLPPPPLHSFCTAGVGQKPTGVLAHFPPGARTLIAV